MAKHVVVTGASTGIGWDAVKILAANGMHVYGSVRRQQDADRLSAEFGASFTPLLFDVTDEAAVHAAAARVRAELAGETLFGLVNNAGIVVPGPVSHLTIGELRRQLEVNVIGQVIVTQAFLPQLGTDRQLAGKPGRIVNISSVAGKLASPFVGAYAASKHALEALSVSLRRELLLYGIDVIVVAPGPVKTPIWNKTEQYDIHQFAGTDYAPAIESMRKYMMGMVDSALPSEQLGSVILTALTTRSPRARYAPVPRKFTNWILPRLLPERTVDRLIGKQLKLSPAARPKG